MDFTHDSQSSNHQHKSALLKGIWALWWLKNWIYHIKKYQESSLRFRHGLNWPINSINDCQGWSRLRRRCFRRGILSHSQLQKMTNFVRLPMFYGDSMILSFPFIFSLNLYWIKKNEKWKKWSKHIIFACQLLTKSFLIISSTRQMPWSNKSHCSMEQHTHTLSPQSATLSPNTCPVRPNRTLSTVQESSEFELLASRSCSCMTSVLPCLWPHLGKPILPRTLISLESCPQCTLWTLGIKCN